MKTVLEPFLEGFKGSFILSAGIILAIGAVLSAFVNHSLSLKDLRVGFSRQGDSNSDRPQTKGA